MLYFVRNLVIVKIREIDLEVNILTLKILRLHKLIRHRQIVIYAGSLQKAINTIKKLREFDALKITLLNEEGKNHEI